MFGIQNITLIKVNFPLISNSVYIKFCTSNKEDLKNPSRMICGMFWFSQNNFYMYNILTLKRYPNLAV